MTTVKRRNPPPWLRPHPIKGKNKADYVAITYCDCGQPDRRTVERRHYSWDSALREFLRAFHGHKRTGRGHWRLWTEDLLNRTMWDTNGLVPVESATPKVALVRLLAQLQYRLDAVCPHSSTCNVRWDRPCDCQRGELKRLLEDFGSEKKPEIYRRIRRDHETEVPGSR